MASRRVFVPRIFIICPVRGLDEGTKRALEQYIRSLEEKGYIVHWPPRDTNQSDLIGLKICETSREAIRTANEVHIWFDPNSEGTFFDLGMLFTFLKTDKKKVVLINPDQVQPTPYKSFKNVLLELAKE